MGAWNKMWNLKGIFGGKKDVNVYFGGIKRRERRIGIETVE